jgi:aldehyde dehydrogenase (NAD+)
MAAPVVTRTGHVIAGAVVDTATDRIEVVNPATEEVIADVPAGTAADVDAAVSAATAAFPAWSATPVAARAAIVRRVSEGLAARGSEIAATITAEMGSPITFARRVQAAVPVHTSAGIADLLDGGYPFGEEIGNSLVTREPIGVVGCITPWNYPLHQIVAKVVPAIAAGCTVVLKPSEMAPLVAGIFLDVLRSAGVPDGVVNLVHGVGPVVGEAIAGHPGVDMVSFTGSTRAGRRVSVVAAETVKRVALELGGKSANVILPDADLDKAVKLGVANTYINGGQTCTAWTRMLVPADRQDEVTDRVLAATAKYGVGDPTDERTRIGPMASAAQRSRVLGYISKGVAEGATLATGGPGPDRGPRLLRAANGVHERPPGHDRRAGGDLRPGPVDPALRGRGRGGGDRQLDHLRPGRRGLLGRHGPRDRDRASAAHRPGRHQRRPVQPGRPVRRLPPVRQRPRTGPFRPRGVPGDQVHPTLIIVRIRAL